MILYPKFTKNGYVLQRSVYAVNCISHISIVYFYQMPPFHIDMFSLTSVQG